MTAMTALGVALVAIGLSTAPSRSAMKIERTNAAFKTSGERIPAYYSQYNVKVTVGGQTINCLFPLDRSSKDRTWTVAVELKEGKG